MPTFTTPSLDENNAIKPKKYRWKSLRIKILAWSFVPTVIILSAVAWFTFYSYQKVIGDLAIKQYPEVITPKAMTFAQTFNGIFNPVLVPIMMEIDINHDLPIEVRAQNILDQAKGIDTFDGGIYFLDQQGRIFKTYPPQPELIGQDWSDTPHFRSVHATPNFGADTDLITIGSSGRKILCVALAMTGQSWDDVVGAIYYCFSISPSSQNVFFQKMDDLNLGSNVYVVDRNHQIIYSADRSEAGRDLSGKTYIQQLWQSETNSGRFDIEGEDRVVGFVSVFPGIQIDRASWFMLSEKSWADVMQPSRPYQQLLLVLLGLGVIVPALVTSYGVRHITQPIQQLIHAAGQVTAGQFRHRIEVKTEDEIESLADQFNLMSAELDESYSSLEKKVSDRTSQLAVMNAIISVASQSLNIKAILEGALDTTVEQMAFDSGAAFRFEDGSSTVLLVAQKGLEPDVAAGLVRRYADPSQRQPVYPKDVTTLGIQDFQDEILKEHLSRLNLQQLIYVPLSTKGRELGFFVLAKHQPGIRSPEELALLSSIGKQVGVAMENAHLYEQAEKTAILSERNRLARELHDAVTQTLFSASIIADVTPQIWKRDPEEGMQHLDELRQLTRGALAEMRTLLLEMRPESLKRADLKSLLTQLSDAFIGRMRVPLDLQIHGECELTQEVKLVFYRVAQEALANIAKHSGARHVVIRLDCQTAHLHLFIQDDGLGFDSSSIPPGHLGVAIMQERASSIGACLTVDSKPGLGTTIELDWKPARKEGIDEYTSDDSSDVGRRP